MKRDEAQSLRGLLEEGKPITVVCTGQKHEFTQTAGIQVGSKHQLIGLVESGKEIDLFDNLEPALVLDGQKLALSYIDFELWHSNVDWNPNEFDNINRIN